MENNGRLSGVDRDFALNDGVCRYLRATTRTVAWFAAYSLIARQFTSFEIINSQTCHNAWYNWPQITAYFVVSRIALTSSFNHSYTFHSGCVIGNMYV